MTKPVRSSRWTLIHPRYDKTLLIANKADLYCDV